MRARACGLGPHGRRGHPRGRGARMILSLTRDREQTVKDAAVEALFELGPDAAAPLAPDMRRRLQSSEPRERIAATWALAALGDDASLRVLSDRAESGQTHEERAVARAAVLVLREDESSIVEGLRRHEHEDVPPSRSPPGCSDGGDGRRPADPAAEATDEECGPRAGPSSTWCVRTRDGGPQPESADASRRSTARRSASCWTGLWRRPGAGLAEASIPAGGSTQRHYHARTEEIYVAWTARARWRRRRPAARGGRRRDPHPAGAWHEIRAGADAELRFLCCCAPPYSDEDTFFE